MLGLVSVDEHQVVRFDLASDQVGEAVRRRAYDDVHPIGDAGQFEVTLREFRVLGVDLQRRHVRGGTREPDRRVAAQGADLQDAAGATHAGQQRQQSALVGRHLVIG